MYNIGVMRGEPLRDRTGQRAGKENIMMKMSQELSNLFQCQNIQVINASTGVPVETINGENKCDRVLLANEYMGHPVYCINPGTEIRDGQTVEILQIWMEV